MLACVRIVHRLIFADKTLISFLSLLAGRRNLQHTVAFAFANVMRAIEHGDSAAVLDSAVLVLRRKIGERNPGTSKAPSYY